MRLWTRLYGTRAVHFLVSNSFLIILYYHHAPFSAMSFPFVPPEMFVYKNSSTGDDMYGLLFKPHNHEPGKQYPTIQFVYGGPQVSRCLSRQAVLLVPYAVEVQMSLAPLSWFPGSRVPTAHVHQCCRFQSYAKTVPSQIKLTTKLTKREPTFVGSMTMDHVITACDVWL